MGAHTFYMKVIKMLEDLKAAMRRVQCNPRNKGKNREHVWFHISFGNKKLQNYICFSVSIYF